MIVTQIDDTYVIALGYEAVTQTMEIASHFPVPECSVCVRRYAGVPIESFDAALALRGMMLDFKLYGISQRYPNPYFKVMSRDEFTIYASRHEQAAA